MIDLGAAIFWCRLFEHLPNGIRIVKRRSSLVCILRSTQNEIAKRHRNPIIHNLCTNRSRKA